MASLLRRIAVAQERAAQSLADLAAIEKLRADRELFPLKTSIKHAEFGVLDIKAVEKRLSEEAAAEADGIELES